MKSSSLIKIFVIISFIFFSTSICFCGKVSDLKYADGIYTWKEGGVCYIAEKPPYGMQVKGKNNAPKGAPANSIRALPKKTTVRYSVFSRSNKSVAKKDLKRSLRKKYKNSYSTIELLLNSGMRDYDKLCSIPDTPINNGILTKLKNKYYPSFSTILLLYKSNKKSYNDLKD